MMAHNLLQGEVIPGKHEQLISPQVFFRVHYVQATIPQEYTTQKYDSRLPLRNYLTCATCGTYLTGYEVNKKGILYYKCNKLICRVN